MFPLIHMICFIIVFFNIIYQASHIFRMLVYLNNFDILLQLALNIKQEDYSLRLFIRIKQFNFNFMLHLTQIYNYFEVLQVYLNLNNYNLFRKYRLYLLICN